MLYPLSIDFSILDLWIIENEEEACFSSLSIIPSPGRYIWNKDNDGSSWGSGKGKTITYGIDTLKKEFLQKKFLRNLFLQIDIPKKSIFAEFIFAVETPNQILEFCGWGTLMVPDTKSTAEPLTTIFQFELLLFFFFFKDCSQ